MTVRSAKFKTGNLGIRLPSTDSRKVLPVEFEDINNLDQQYADLRASIPSNSQDLLNHHLACTCTDASRDDSPFELCQEICYLELVSPQPRCEMDEAAIKLQKVYKSYRTRRNLADCAVVVEELWWRALDFASLKRSSISFFNDEKPETTASRWARALTRAAKVGKGLSKSEKAQKLALQHWLEAIDPRHRYGHNLQFYYDVWFESESTQPFFYWLDVGDGKEFSLKKCPRSILQQQCIKYLGPKERKAYEVTIKDGKLIYKLTELIVHTPDDAKWIFVLSTHRALYVGQKEKGKFQHSSFLAGGATTSAGRLVVKDGFLKAIWPHSGHYLPTEENFKEFINFLEENNVDLTNVKTCSIDEDDRSFDHSSSFKMSRNKDAVMTRETKEAEKDQTVAEPTDTTDTDKLAKELEFDNESNIDKPPLIESSEPLARKWTTGTGTRIGCMREYSSDLQCLALEQVSLSSIATPATRTKTPIPSPRLSPGVRVSPQLEQMYIHAPTISLTLPKPKKRT